MIGLSVLCWFWVLELVSVFSQVKLGTVFSNFFLFRITYVRYLIAICERRIPLD